MKSLVRPPVRGPASLTSRHTTGPRRPQVTPLRAAVLVASGSDYNGNVPQREVAVARDVIIDQQGMDDAIMYAAEVPDMEVVVKDIVDQDDSTMYKFEEIPSGTFKLDKKGARVRQVVVKADALLEQYSGTVHLSYGPSQEAARTGTMLVSAALARTGTLKQPRGTTKQRVGTFKQRVGTIKQRAGTGKQRVGAGMEQASSRPRVSTVGRLLELPETINARAAMLGCAGALASEILTHQPVAQQLGAYPSATALALVTGVATSAVVASLIPMFRANESVRDRSFGPFTPDLEVAVGRTAMLGFLGWVGLEAVLGGVALFGGSGAAL